MSDSADDELTDDDGFDISDHDPDAEILCLEADIIILKAEITRLKQKCNALVTAAKISLVPAAMFMELETVDE